jgi:hypothetical protein
MPPGVVIVIALVQSILRVLPLRIGGALDVLDHGVFQALCGTIMTLRIAMEFKHSGHPRRAATC